MFKSSNDLINSCRLELVPSPAAPLTAELLSKTVVAFLPVSEAAAATKATTKAAAAVVAALLSNYRMGTRIIASQDKMDETV